MTLSNINISLKAMQNLTQTIESIRRTQELLASRSVQYVERVNKVHDLLSPLLVQRMEQISKIQDRIAPCLTQYIEQINRTHELLAPRLIQYVEQISKVQEQIVPRLIQHVDQMRFDRIASILADIDILETINAYKSDIDLTEDDFSDIDTKIDKLSMVDDKQKYLIDNPRFAIILAFILFICAPIWDNCYNNLFHPGRPSMHTTKKIVMMIGSVSYDSYINVYKTKIKENPSKNSKSVAELSYMHNIKIIDYNNHKKIWAHIEWLNSDGNIEDGWVFSNRIYKGR